MRIHRWVIWGLFFLALALRFGFGSLASSILPTIEGGSQPQQAGYLFYDAYHRDLQAYELAASDQPLMVAFKSKNAPPISTVACCGLWHFFTGFLAGHINLLYLNSLFLLSGLVEFFLCFQRFRDYLQKKSL